MKEFEPLIGAWHGEGEVPIEPPMRVSSDATLERMGEFIVFRSVGQPADVPDTIAIIGGAPDGEPQPMHYFDSRGVKRLFMTALEGRPGTSGRPPARTGTAPTVPASTNVSSARSRMTARRSWVAGSAGRVMREMTGRSTSRSTTSAGSAAGYPASCAARHGDGPRPARRRPDPRRIIELGRGEADPPGSRPEAVTSGVRAPSTAGSSANSAELPSAAAAANWAACPNPGQRAIRLEGRFGPRQVRRLLLEEIAQVHPRAAARTASRSAMCSS